MKALITLLIASALAHGGAVAMAQGHLFVGGFLIGAALGGTWVIGKEAGREEAEGR
jgi:hypothetical protein